MKPIRFFCTLALLAFPLCANAQPDPNNAPKGENPVNRPVGGRRGGIQNMTPAQIKTLVETSIKRQLVAANVTSDAQQSAVIDFILGEVAARQKLTGATRALQVALRNPDSTDAQIAGLLNDLQAASDEEKARHQKALDALKAAIDVTQFPRLEAMLTLTGFYGDLASQGGGLGQIIGGLGGNRGGQPPFDIDLRFGQFPPPINGNGDRAGGVNLGGARGNRADRRRYVPAPF